MISNYIEEDFVRQTRGQPAKMTVITPSINTVWRMGTAHDASRRVLRDVFRDATHGATRRATEGKTFRGKKVLDGEDTTRRATARRDARRDASPMYKSNGKEATSRRYGTTSCRRVVWWRRLRPTRRCVS